MGSASRPLAARARAGGGPVLAAPRRGDQISAERCHRGKACQGRYVGDEPSCSTPDGISSDLRMHASRARGTMRRPEGTSPGPADTGSRSPRHPSFGARCPGGCSPPGAPGGARNAHREAQLSILIPDQRHGLAGLGPPKAAAGHVRAEHDPRPIWTDLDRARRRSGWSESRVRVALDCSWARVAARQPRRLRPLPGRYRRSNGR